MKEIVNIELNKNLILEIKGEYSKLDPEVGFSSDFEIDSIEIVSGTILDLLEYSFKRDIVVELEEKAINLIESI